MTTGEFYDWQTGGGGGDIGRLLRCWAAAHIRWCVIGGLAVNHWAKEPLITKDADVVVTFNDLIEAGANEVWICDKNGNLHFFLKDEPETSAKTSLLCPEMRRKIKA